MQKNYWTYFQKLFNAMKKVSIIIPLYNRANLITETLDCLSADLHLDEELEIFVVDDGSTDGGDMIVQQNYPQVILLRQENAGAPAARNNGLKKATGEYVLFLDSDDLIEPNFFKSKILCLETNPHVAGVYGPWEHFNVDEKGEKIILPRHTSYPIETTPGYQTHLKRLLSGWFIVCHALLWRRKALLEVNGYDTSLPVNQDVDLLFKILIKRNLIIGINAPKALYRDHQDQQRTGDINNSDKKLYSILNLRKRFVNELTKEDLLSQSLKKEVAQFCFNYWASNYKRFPQVAKEFYVFSKSLNVPISVNGSMVYKLIGKIAGAKNAVILKSLIK